MCVCVGGIRFEVLLLKEEAQTSAAFASAAAFSSAAFFWCVNQVEKSTKRKKVCVCVWGDQI